MLCHGDIISIVNARTNYVQVRWASEFVEDGQDVTKEKVLKTKWNPSNPAGAHGGNILHLMPMRYNYTILDSVVVHTMFLTSYYP